MPDDVTALAEMTTKLSKLKLAKKPKCAIVAIGKEFWGDSTRTIQNKESLAVWLRPT
jgi:hypothetical protein